MGEPGLEKTSEVLVLRIGRDTIPAARLQFKQHQLADFAIFANLDHERLIVEAALRGRL